MIKTEKIQKKIHCHEGPHTHKRNKTKNKLNRKKNNRMFIKIKNTNLIFSSF